MILVTGGTGLLGNCVIRELVSRGTEVRALCRQGTSREPFAGLNLEVVQGDLSSSEQLRRHTQGCKAVIHSAAFIHIGWTRLAESRQVNVEGTRHVVEACLANRVRLVHISTVDTFPAASSIEAPISETSSTGVPKVPCNYVVSKREADDVVRCAVREQGLNAVLIHPGLMLGPYDWKPSSGRLMLGVAKAPLAIAPTGGCSLCDPRDVANAIVNAVQFGATGQSYITAGHNMPYRALWQHILAAAGKNNKRVLSPQLVLGTAGLVTDGLVKLLGIREGDINSAAIAMGRLLHYYDSENARQQLGYSVRPWESSLTDAWRWLTSRSR